MKSTIFSRRLTELRMQKKKTQKEFGRELAVFMGRQADFSVSAVSAWELGNKTPSMSTVAAMSEYFQVSVEYLRGMTDDMDAVESVYYDYLQMKYKIDKNKIEAYDETPVWIEFESEQYSNRWGLVSISKAAIICSDCSVPLKATGYNLYVIPLPNDIFTEAFLLKPLSWSQINHYGTKPFWVEVVSKDAKIKLLYNGWYHHNENKTCIINEIGLSLPYTGFGISWRAYSEPFRR